jgi:hypothetical protein
MNKPKIWFLTPSVDTASGGINNFYRLCGLAEELGIEAYILSETPYPCCDPPELTKFWREIQFSHHYQSKYDHPEIQDGDIIIQPEIYNWKSIISKRVRRITYVQNWALTGKRDWQDHYWTYNNNVNLTFSINNSMRMTDVKNNIVLPLPGQGEMDLHHTRGFIEADKISWSLVSPYFESENFSFGENDPSKILMFPRKSGWIAHEFKKRFGDKVILADGLQPEQVLDLYRQVGMVILPSPAEGLCFPAVEAMLSGAVVVSWPCGAPEEFLIDGITGMMARFGDINDLISKTEHLLNNPSKREEIAKNARQLAEKLFSKERSKMELFLAYHQACNYKLD